MKKRIDTHEGRLGTVVGQMREIWIEQCHPQTYNSCESLQQLHWERDRHALFGKVDHVDFSIVVRAGQAL